jgi:hypothetical protein
VATRSWPASDAPGRASSGFDSAASNSIGMTSRTPSHNTTRLDRMVAIARILPRRTGRRKLVSWWWRLGRLLQIEAVPVKGCRDERNPFSC